MPEQTPEPPTDDDLTPAGPMAGSPNLEANERYRRMRERDEVLAKASPEPLTDDKLREIVRCGRFSHDPTVEPPNWWGQKAADAATGLLAARARIAALEAQLERVRDVHAPIEAMNMRHPGGRLTQVCSGCGTDNGNWQMYPCPTIRALEVRNA